MRRCDGCAQTELVDQFRGRDTTPFGVGLLQKLHEHTCTDGTDQGSVRDAPTQKMEELALSCACEKPKRSVANLIQKHASRLTFVRAAMDWPSSIWRVRLWRSMSIG